MENDSRAIDWAPTRIRELEAELAALKKSWGEEWGKFKHEDESLAGNLERVTNLLDEVSTRVLRLEAWTVKVTGAEIRQAVERITGEHPAGLIGDDQHYSAPIGRGHQPLGGLFAVGDHRRGVVSETDQERIWQRGFAAAIDEAQSRVGVVLDRAGITGTDLRKKIMGAIAGDTLAVKTRPIRDNSQG